MAWIVELLDDRVRDELESLPLDMQARFRRIVELIQGYGLNRVHEPAHKAPGRRVVGNAHEGQGRDIQGDLRYRERPPGCGRPRLHQENAEDAPARD